MRIAIAASLQVVLTVAALCAVGSSTDVPLHSRSNLSIVPLQSPVTRSVALNRSVSALHNRADRVRVDNRAERARFIEPQLETAAIVPDPAELVRESVDADARIADAPAELAEAVAELTEADSAKLDVDALAPIAELPAAANAESPAADTLPITGTVDWSAAAVASAAAPAPRFTKPRRFTDPNFMRTMYFTHAALQMTDAVTTLSAVGKGAREANPLLRSAARNPAALIAVKAGAVAGTTLLLEKLRKDRPVVAAVTLVAINAAVTVVAVNNAHVIAKQPRR
jgi:hypothetical protein